MNLHNWLHLVRPARLCFASVVTVTKNRNSACVCGNLQADWKRHLFLFIYLVLKVKIPAIIYFYAFLKKVICVRERSFYTMVCLNKSNRLKDVYFILL